jgi:GAF domain-containing protein
MGIHADQVASRSSVDLHTIDARRTLLVNAKLAMCLQPEFDQVSISVVGPDGDVSTWAEDGELAGDLDRLQYDLGEGPCLDSIRSAGCIVAAHIQHADRWGCYVPAATRLGLRSQVSAPLLWRDEPLGALNMYSTADGQVGLTAPLVAEVLAAQVASSLAGFREITHLHSALDASTSLGQATGLVMARLEIDADHAAAYLRQVSMRTNQKLARVAEDLVRTGRLPSVPPV